MKKIMSKEFLQGLGFFILLCTGPKGWVSIAVMSHYGGERQVALRATTQVIGFGFVALVMLALTGLLVFAIASLLAGGS